MKAPLVSIVCVFNNLELRQACLDRSLDGYVGDPEIEFIPVDNRGGEFVGAGVALNRGASAATGEVLAFVQQDVRLHSVSALKHAARLLLDSHRYGLLGAVGMDSDGQVRGRIRDRVVLLGSSAPEPVDVDSVDEVLFMVSRRSWEQRPIDESPELGWHAYAVEYGLWLRDQGLRTGVVDIPLTHNSLSGNLVGLIQAQAYVARRHPRYLPLWSTCGVLRHARPDGQTDDAGKAGIATRLIASHRWRYRWLCKSVLAARARALTRAPVVLGDIRRNIDQVLGDDTMLRVVNIEREPSAFSEAGVDAGSSLSRGDRVFAFEVVTPSELASIIAARDVAHPMLLTNLRMRDLAVLGAAHWIPRTVGLHEGIGFWALIGGAAAGRLDVWPPRSLPAGARAWSRLAGERV